MDEKEALRRIGGERDVLLEVIGAFLETYAAGFAELEDALAREDREALAFAAHRSRGALSQLAAMPALQAASRLEEFALRAPQSELRAVFAQYKAELERLIPLLVSMAGETAPS